MIKSVATAIAGLMFVIGFALVGISPKASTIETSNVISTAKLKPSADMLKAF